MASAKPISRYAKLLAASMGLLASGAGAILPSDGLEKFDYKELMLLKVVPGDGRLAAACFLAFHDGQSTQKYIWIHPGEHVGNRLGTLKEVSPDRVRILELLLLNGTDWMEVNFYWPVASGKEAEKLAVGCGDKPNR